MNSFHKLIVLELVLCTIISGQSVELPQVFINKNEIKNIPIFIYNVNNLNAISIMIEYDETVLEFRGFNHSQNNLGNSYSYTQNEAFPGEITLTAYNIMGEQFNGSGKIGYISFEKLHINSGYISLENSKNKSNNINLPNIAIENFQY